ncbi:MAG: hypothetical protein GX160_07885 [Clostridiales bacterium]|nr:hypothetical protein [Clostridiales bacterium]NLV89554.1 hypothetical protein [Tissierellia bacterium]
MKHIVFFSGGIGSYYAAKRVVEKHGKSNVILLFTDTKMEDDDLYRFLDDASKKLDVELVKIADGRTPWEVAFDVKFLPNSRIAPCSHILKQKVARKYIEEHFKADECILYLGIDWTEQHRTAAPIKHWAPYKVEFPLCQPPYLTKKDMLSKLEKEEGIKVPELYKLGFAHNNCGGFCFRAGIGHFKHLLETKPDLYKFHEDKEQELREYLGRDDISILRRTKNRQKYNITLKKLREELESQHVQLSIEDLLDIGGCGCFVDDDENMNFED